MDFKEMSNDDLLKRINDLESDIAAKDALQHSLKILMNSLFGALGNKWFREMFDIRIAEGITLSGKLAILWIGRKIDEYMNRVLKLGAVEHKIHHTNRPVPATTLEVVQGRNFVIYSDTDSIYIDMSMLVDKFFTQEQQVNEVDRITEFLDTLFKTKIEPYIDECYKELADYVNADHRMFMKREVIAPAAIWTAKKRYTMLVSDSEGVRYPFPNMYHKTVGLDAVKGSAPKFCREWMFEGYKLALNGTEDQLHDMVSQKKKLFYKLPIEQIATPTGVNGLEKYRDPDTVYIKGAPKQVKAALWHNHLIKKLGVKGRSAIMSGDKILFVELKNPNPYGCECIAFQGTLPKEFGLEKFVDYDSNYQKNFIKPLHNLLDAVKWNSEKTASAFDWFA